jgi:hypothetical protein
MPSQIIIRPRAGGKTTELIKHAAETGAYIICPNMAQADFVWKRAKQMHLQTRIHHPITWHDFTTGRYYGQGIIAFVIDNAEQCIQSMTSVPIVGLTITGETAPRWWSRVLAWAFSLSHP